MQGRDVEDGDVFSFNETFTAQLFRIKINSIQMKESLEENRKTNDQVMQDRQYQVQSGSPAVHMCNLFSTLCADAIARRLIWHAAMSTSLSLTCSFSFLHHLYAWA